LAQLVWLNDSETRIPSFSTIDGGMYCSVVSTCPVPGAPHYHSDDDGSVQIGVMVGEQLRHMLAVRAARKKETVELFKKLFMEDMFGDCKCCSF
jgi:hypothetical protein